MRELLNPRIRTPIHASARRSRSDRVARTRPVTTGERDQVVDLALELHLVGERGGGALEPEHRERDLPAVVDVTDDEVGVGARAVEEHLAELGRAREIADRSYLDAGLVHRHQEHREAAVLRRVGVGATQHVDPVGVVAERRPDLLAVDDPLVAVERRARVRTLARSEPASGSLKPWHQITSAARISGRKRCFCSSVPTATIVGPIISVPWMLRRYGAPACAHS